MTFNLHRTLKSGETKEFELEGDRVTIGRDPNNQVSIPESYVSSRHAILTREADGSFAIEDCESSNGTYVNSAKVEGKHPFKIGDVIKIAYVDLKVVEKAVNAIPVVPLKSRKKNSGKITSP